MINIMLLVYFSCTSSEANKMLASEKENKIGMEMFSGSAWTDLDAFNHRTVTDFKLFQ